MLYWFLKVLKHLIKHVYPNNISNFIDTNKTNPVAFLTRQLQYFQLFIRTTLTSSYRKCGTTVQENVGIKYKRLNSDHIKPIFETLQKMA